MSRQASLDAYFKSKSNVMAEQEKIMRKRSLSLKRHQTPNKSPKLNKEPQSQQSEITIKTEENVIDLCSEDDEEFIKMEPDFLSLTSNNTEETQQTAESNPTTSDTPQGYKDEPLTPNGKVTEQQILTPVLKLNSSQSGDETNSSTSTILYNLTPSTPQKSNVSTFKSPQSSKKKYFSPSKKRAVVKKSPVKRNLSFSSSQHTGDEVFDNACAGMDDKTKFMLTIINNILKDSDLRQLLDNNSQELLTRCLHVTKPGARLICRLFWRLDKWYSRNQLRKIVNDMKQDLDDPSLTVMLNCLVDNGLVSISADFGSNVMSFDEYAKLLKTDEIKQICKDLKLKINSKQDAIVSLKRFCHEKSISSYFNGNTSNNSKRVMGIMKSKVGACYKLSRNARNALYKLYVLMYLGINFETIREKRLELVLINDKINMETYPIDKEMQLDTAAVVFGSRDEFEKYLNAHLIYEEYLAETDTLKKCDIVKKVHKLYNDISCEDMTRYKSYPTWLHRFTPPYLFVKMLESGIQELKKHKQCQLALDILTMLICQAAFRQHKKAGWYAEKALILHTMMALHKEAAELLIEGLKSNLSSESKDAMRPRANKIAKQQNIELDSELRSSLLEHASKELILESKFKADHINKQPMENYQQRGKIKFAVHNEEGRIVMDCEEYCIFHYISKGSWTHGEHWEGRLIKTIYFLLFWDIIYSKPRGVNGIFLTPYQMFPLDMYCESFYTNRKALIDDWLVCIENMDTDNLVEIMFNKWKERPESELSGIDRRVPWDSISSVVKCLGGSRAAAICRRLAINYGYAHSGFPDLTLWNVNTNKIKFVEVKTDTDKPSVKQLQWMQYLTEHDIDTGFCYVGVNTTRSRARASHTGGME